MENRIRILERALTQYGIVEIPGKEKNNPEILKYFKIIGKTWIKDDETAWCSAAMNWVCKMEGLDCSGELNARSWLKVGCETVDPKPGNIVVLWRESMNSWKGHVGVFIKHDRDRIWILGGNQSNSFQISTYAKFKLLGYRKI